MHGFINEIQARVNLPKPKVDEIIRRIVSFELECGAEFAQGVLIAPRAV